MNLLQRTSLKLNSKIQTSYKCPLSCGKTFHNKRTYNNHIKLHFRTSVFCSKCNQIFGDQIAYDNHITEISHRQRQQVRNLTFQNDVPLNSSEVEIYAEAQDELATISNETLNFPSIDNFFQRILQMEIEHIKIINPNEVLSQLHLQKSPHYPYSNGHNSFFASWFHKTNTSQEAASELLNYLSNNSNMDVARSFSILQAEEEGAFQLVTSLKIK